MKNLFILFFLLTFTSIKAQSEYGFYRVDTLHSNIYWKCDKHNGLIKLKDGGFVLSGNHTIVGGKFIIDMHTIKDLDMNIKQYGTAVMIFENTLKNEFFEADTYPYAVFELQKIEKIKTDRYKLTGDFTLHGITNCISFEAAIQIDEKTIVLKSDQFSIDRTDWGIYRMSPKRPYSDDENGWTVPDTIELHIEIKAIKE